MSRGTYGTAESRAATRSTRREAEGTEPGATDEGVGARGPAEHNGPCPGRFVTHTAPQALTLLNGSFFHEQAGHFADRLRREAPADPIGRACRLAFNRDPSAVERDQILAAPRDLFRLTSD